MRLKPEIPQPPRQAACRRAVAALLVPTITLALAIWGGVLSAQTQRKSAEPDPLADTTNTWPGEKECLRAGMAASVHGLDSTLSDSKFRDWIQRTVGSDAQIHWEANDCGEATGSPSDSARDLPVCVEARAVLSGGRELYVSVAVGTMNKGVIAPAGLWDAAIVGPDTSVSFSRLSDLERYLVRGKPILGDSMVYLDERRNVHVVTFAKRDVRITKDGRYRDPKLSPDGQSIGMLVTSTVDRGYGQTYEPVEVAQELWIYRGGRVVRRLLPEGFIRAWDFANNGKAVAIYSGALHFAGFYVLYDSETGVELEHAEDPVTDSSPEWVRGISP